MYDSNARKFVIKCVISCIAIIITKENHNWQRLSLLDM